MSLQHSLEECVSLMTARWQTDEPALRAVDGHAELMVSARWSALTFVVAALLCMPVSCGGRPAAPAVTQRPAAAQQLAERPKALSERRSLITLRIATGLAALALSLVALSPTPALIAAVGTEKATSMIQWVSAASAGTEVVLSPVIGSLVDALGRKPLLVFAMTMLALAQTVVACTVKYTASAAILARRRACPAVLDSAERRDGEAYFRSC